MCNPGPLNGVQENGDTNHKFLIAGICASAGGIQDLKEFFSQVPSDSGIAYVVILHLLPDHDSKLAEVLQVVSKIPVTQVTKKMAIAPDHIYIVAPSKHLTMLKRDIVVLSGTGANGSMGLISERIITYKKKLPYVHIPVEVRLRTGHDFSNYKRPTLLRRIEQRITVCNLPNLVAYASYLAEHPQEMVALLKDLLISVSNFFRYKKAFEALERGIIPLIVKHKTAQEQVRIWVAGCATGEEAYSMAMLCAEQKANLPDAPKIQIFATDIDEAAKTKAREGLYSINDAADVSPERLRRFFNKEGGNYRIRRKLREMVLFALHNFIKDPPFSHLHLVTCRHVLIHLNRTAQERVMDTFHFALNTGGYLFLGTYKSIESSGSIEANGLKVQLDNRIETVNIPVKPVLREEDVARGFMPDTTKIADGALTSRFEELDRNEWIADEDQLGVKVVITEKHGGAIGVESKEGARAVFLLTLPYPKTKKLVHETYPGS